MNRGGFSVQRVRLPLQSHLYKARGASLPERSTHYRAMFRYALPYISNLKKLVLWYLLLEVFTRTSFPARNSITVARRRAPASLTVFKVRSLATTGFLKWLLTLATRRIVYCKRLKSRHRFHEVQTKRIHFQRLKHRPPTEVGWLSASRCFVSVLLRWS